MPKFGKLTVTLWVFDGMRYKHIPVMKQGNVTREDAQQVFDDVKDKNMQIGTDAYCAWWRAEPELLY